MQDQERKTKIAVIVGSAALTSLLYYATPNRHALLQELFTRFFYVPIFLGGFWFGLRGGVIVSLLVTLICLPHFFGQWRDPALLYDELLELFLFNIAGPLVGALSDREQRQRVLNQELQTLAALGETAASVAHEIKNMVIPIRGFLRRIRINHPLDSKAASYLDIVGREAAKLDKMTQDMLSFARHASLEREVVEVNFLVEEVRQCLHEDFRDNGIRLICKSDGGRQTVLLDRQRICQALVNLLHNALHASPRGKEVRLLTYCNRDSLLIVVEDEGAGIPQEQLARIFQPFFTTKQKGTGLGLAITQRIVKEHGGKIRVESTPGVGTRVLLDFPVCQEKTVRHRAGSQQKK